MKKFAAFQNLKIGDFIIFAIICMVAVSSAVLFYRSPADAKVLKVYRNGEEYATHTLSTPYAQSLTVFASDEYDAGYCRLIIENETVTVEETTCPNKDCARMGTLKDTGDVIICLPYRLVIRLEGGDAVDAVSY